MPRGMPGFGWRFRGGGYYTDKSVPTSKVEKKLKEALSKVTKGHTWTDGRGVKHTEIVVDNEIVGNLWEDVDPASLKLGGYWVTPMGIKAELETNDRVVGMIWLPV
jgi:hypothetical protein